MNWILHRVAPGLRLILALVAGLLFSAITAHAADRIELSQARVEAQEDFWVLSADFGLELTPRLEEALNRGLPLYFAIELEMNRPRWYWFDEKAVSASLHYRLSYNTLTRQYRLSTGSLQQSFATLSEAIGVMTRVRNWRIAERSVLKMSETYQAAIRMRLDVSQLPKPFQINAITDRDWTLDSDWKRFTVSGEGAR